MCPTVRFNERFKHVTLYSRKIECESLNELESLCTCGFTPAINIFKVKHFPFFQGLFSQRVQMSVVPWFYNGYSLTKIYTIVLQKISMVPSPPGCIPYYLLKGRGFIGHHRLVVARFGYHY